MNTYLSSRFYFLLRCLTLFIASFVIGRFSQAQSLTLQGRLTTSSGSSVEGNPVLFRVKILSPDHQCVLYDETQSKDLTSSGGLFSITLNDGSGTRNDTNSWTFAQAIANRGSFAVNSVNCGSGTGTVTFTPSSTDERKVQISFKDPTMATYDFMPTATLSHSAYASDSSTLSGAPLTSLVRVEDSGVAGTATALTTANYTELLAIINGTTSQYAKANGTGFTPTASVSFNSQRLTNLASPTASTDATNKTYVDSYVGGMAVNTSVVSALTSTDNGKVLQWNGTQWTAATPAVSSQWTTNGTGIYYSSGNVGIGTTSPAQALELSGGGRARFTGAGSTNYGEVYYNTGTGLMINASSGDIVLGSNTRVGGVYHTGSGLFGGTGTALNLGANGTSNYTMTFATSGNVGIGTTAPTNALTFPASSTGIAFHNQVDQTTNYEDVTFGYSSNTFAIASNAGGTGTARPIYLQRGSGGTNGYIGFNGSGGASVMAANGQNMSIGANSTTAWFIPGGTSTFSSANANGAQLNSGAATTTNPTLVPNRNDATSGFGAPASGQLSMIIAGAEKVRIDASGNVGIGTTAPSTKLQVAGSVMLGNGAETCSSTYAGAIRYNVSSTSVEFCNGTGWLVMSSGSASGATSATSITGSTGITLNPGTGAVVVNSATASTSSSTGALTVAGGVGVTGAIYSGSSINATTSVSAASTLIPQMYGGSSGDLKVDGNSAGTGNVLLATSGGKVGIGTTSPGSLLTVAGNANVTGSGFFGAGATGASRTEAAANYVRIYSGAETGTRVSLNTDILTGAGGGISFSTSGGSTGTVASGGTNGNLAFYTSGANERMRIDNSGNVGIGTTSPSYLLDVNGTGRLTSSASAGTTLTATHTGNGTGLSASTSSGVAVSANGGSGKGLSASSTNYAVYSSGSNGGTAVYATGAANSASHFGIGLYAEETGTNNVGYAAQISNSSAVGWSLYSSGTSPSYFAGSVGIGTTSPSQALDVVGSVRATSFISTSDMRLKKNITPVKGLDLIDQLTGVSWNWVADGKSDAGVIAQQVEQVYPIAVVTDAKSGYKAVKYNALIAPLIQSTKELHGLCQDNQAQLTQQQRQIASLQQENQALRNDVEQLKKQMAKIHALLGQGSK